MKEEKEEVGAKKVPYAAAVLYCAIPNLESEGKNFLLYAALVIHRAEKDPLAFYAAEGFVGMPVYYQNEQVGVVQASVPFNAPAFFCYATKILSVDGWTPPKEQTAAVTLDIQVPESMKLVNKELDDVEETAAEPH